MVNLRLLQLGDSALPVGGYTHSWGLETAIDRGAVHDAATLETWTRSWLMHSIAPMEGVVVAASCLAAAGKDWGRVCEANQIVTASITAPSIRSASREMGEQLLALAATWEWSRNRVEEFASESASEPGGCNYCVAFAVVAAAAGATAEEALGLFLNQSALGMIAAGVRGIPIGHTHAQQILAYLHDDIQELTRSYRDHDITRAGSGSPYYEVLCHEQPRLYTRLFRS